MKKYFLIFLFFVSFVAFSFLYLKLEIKKLPKPPENILILGLDPRDDDLEKTQVTDTIIFANISQKNQKIKLFSLPRDLWYYPAGFKINQLYPESLLQPDSFSYLKEHFKIITGNNIDQVVVITTLDLKNIIDLVGGVDVYLETGFIDDQYPNPDYIVNPSPSIPIYKTIEFKSGWNHLTADNVTEFVRSRKSADTAADGGTDLGRIKRQQLLIDSLLAKIINNKTDLSLLFKLYQYWQQNIKHDFSTVSLLALINQYRFSLFNLDLEKINIPTGENPKTDILFHPQKFINQQWVFITSTPDYQSLHHFIDQSLLY